MLTGEFNVRRADILYDAGRSLNPMIDIGQIQGGFIQGMGNVTTEEIYYDDSGGSGAPLSSNFWNYKPPCSKTIPAKFNTRDLSVRQRRAERLARRAVRGVALQVDRRAAGGAGQQRLLRDPARRRRRP